MNIAHITKQLEEIINIKDTNQLLTVLARQKDIIANISHDLRTPLTTAGGYVQMLQGDVTKEEKQE